VFSKDISPAVEPGAVTGTTVVGITVGVTLVTFLRILTDIDTCLEYYVMIDITAILAVNMGIKVGKGMAHGTITLSHCTENITRTVQRGIQRTC